MKRPAHQEKTLDRIKKWRSVCPELTLRSTFIVGFPGETEEDFQYLLDWLEQAQLDRVGCFEYSPVEGAKANELDDQVPDDIKKDRWERFMQKQQAISAKRLQAKIGKRMEVIVDEQEEGWMIARSKGDAPEIDGLVRIEGHYELHPGDMLEVDIIDADDYDLYAQPAFVE